MDTHRPDIDPDSGVGQVPTQGPQPALMTIDNNLSLFDFQPNSLLETRSGVVVVVVVGVVAFRLPASEMK